MKNVLSVVLAVALLGGAGVGGYLLGVEDGKSQAATTTEQLIAERLRGSGLGETGGSGLAEMWQSLQGQGQGQAEGQLRFPQGQGETGTFTGLAGRGGTIGTVKAVEGNTLIVSTGDREVKVVVSADTRITMTTQGTVVDIEVGERITVAGQTEGDTITATQIQLMDNIP